MPAARRLNALAKAKLSARTPRGKAFNDMVRELPADILVAAARRSTNPLFYRQAYQYARANGLEPHARVLRYFDAVARRLSRPQGRGSKTAYVARCLALTTGSGQSNPFMQSDDFVERINAVVRVLAGERIDVVARDTRIVRRELQAYVQEYRRRGTVTSRKRV